MLIIEGLIAYFWPDMHYVAVPNVLCQWQQAALASMACTMVAAAAAAGSSSERIGNYCQTPRPGPVSSSIMLEDDIVG